MSLYDYRQSQKIAAEDHPFYALIMAAMRKADTANTAKLQQAFPETWSELEARYYAPGGVLPSEVETTLTDPPKEWKAGKVPSDRRPMFPDLDRQGD